MQTKERKTKEKLLIGRKLAYRTIENIFRALPIWWYTMLFVPFYNFRVGVSSSLQRRLKVRLCRARVFSRLRRRVKVRSCRARVSSCSDELRKRRPFGSSDYDQRSMIQISDLNSKPAGDETFAKMYTMYTFQAREGVPKALGSIRLK